MLLIELIQVAIGTRETLTCLLSEEEWKVAFDTARKHAVSGVAFLALEKLNEQGIKPPLPLLYEWIGISGQIKAQNDLTNKRCLEITKLFADAGFRNCILKGQGNALMYPEPLLRTPGDIDIWIEGNRKEIRDFVISKCPNAQDGDLHIEFPVFEDVPVEVHYKPSFSSIPKYDKRLQSWFQEQAREQFSHNVMLGKGEIYVPTPQFNVVQQMSHIAVHFFVEGIGLRQFVDYFYVLKSLYNESCYEDYVGLFKYLGLLKFARGVMWIEKEILGLDEKYLICEPDEKIGRVILKEIVEGGNFGYYDERYAYRRKGYMARGIVDGYRLLKLACYFPKNSLWKLVRKVENQKWKMKEMIARQWL